MPVEIVMEDVASCVVQVVRLIVRHPADVCAEVVGEVDHSSLRITINQEDMGQLIGRKGRTARSLRVLMAAFASRLGMRVALDINSADSHAARGQRPRTIL